MSDLMSAPGPAWMELQGRRRAAAYAALVTQALLQRWLYWVPLVVFSVVASHFVCLSINLTESLPDRVFVVLKQEKTFQRGDYIAFRHPGWGAYPKDAPFVKIVLGLPGDVVEARGRDFYVNGQRVGEAKEKSRTGFPLAAGPTGVIPPGRYFVYTPHPDSFDSRYAATGWIDERRVTGRAIPIY